MGEQIKPDIPTLIHRIKEMASLPESESKKVHKFNRDQLMELYIYISELKHGHKELTAKINNMSMEGSSEE